jgi:hypothetical protein
MFAYSEDGQHFLGYRITSFGKVQVVYDCAGAKHKVFTVETPDVSGQVIGDAIKAAIRTKRVLPTFITNLSSQKIHLRESL